MRVGRGFNGVEKLHITDIVEIDLIFQYHDQAFAIESDGENGGGKGEFTYCRLPLDEEDRVSKSYMDPQEHTL